ncbi:hypothetical protein [Kribbella sp. NBC_00889]|uniref:hypothetical protein n=1 Tax=Kribbella sp. NBC_00889 TaxID=2975974 RepID=UPI003862F6FB|nr:hypothetical protein OG817_30435 [Kribbella sp. NBC_00889]
MRVRGLALGGLALIISAAVGVVVAGPSSADEPVLAKSVGTQLPVQDLRAMELDEARGRLYFAQGAGSALPLVVTDLDGALQKKLTAVTGASDVVLSNDHQQVLVTQDYDRVTALDADTLEPSATYDAPKGACVYSAEPAGDKIVAAFLDCGLGTSGLLIWSAPGTTATVYTDGPNYHPIIAGAANGLLVAGDTGYSPVTTYVIDVSGATPTIVSRRENTGENLVDYAVSPDGTEVVETVGYPYEHHSYKLPDLSDATVYPSGVYPADAAWSGDSSTVAVGRSSTASNDADVLFYAKGSTTPTYAVDFRSSDELWKGTLLLNSTGTRAWAVTYDDTYQNVQLLHSFGPAHAPKAPITDIHVTAPTGSGKDKSTASVTVTWTSPYSRPGSSTNQQFLQLYATPAGSTARLIGNPELTSAGSFTATYALPRGTTTFTAHYKDFENWYPEATVTTTITR